MKYDLTEGNILKQLIKLAIPIMGASFIQMAYNLTDMFWLGKLSSDAVASVGTAGFFLWLSMAPIMVFRLGSQVLVAQEFGKKNYKLAEKIAENAVVTNTIVGLIYGGLIFTFRYQLIGFFHLGDPVVVQDAVNYLAIVAIGMVFFFNNPVFQGIYNATGDSKTPFIIASTGLILNMVLDPVLILYYDFGPVGAASATIFAQFVTYIIFVKAFKSKSAFKEFNLWTRIDKETIKNVIKIGYPEGIRSALFTIFAMIIARILANWGPVPIAIQKVGSQIEAISWRTASGFSMALSSFVGQNYGAKKKERALRGFKYAFSIMVGVGIVASFLLIVFPRPIISQFFMEPSEIAGGVIYLRILGYSQLFMCVEIITAGFFNGLGRTKIPSVVSIFFTGMRVPGALLLSTVIAVEGVWWSISISSIFKGIVLLSIFIILYKKDKLVILDKEDKQKKVQKVELI